MSSTAGSGARMKGGVMGARQGEEGISKWEHGDDGAAASSVGTEGTESGSSADPEPGSGAGTDRGAADSSAVALDGRASQATGRVSIGSGRRRELVEPVAISARLVMSFEALMRDVGAWDRVVAEATNGAEAVAGNLDKMAANGLVPLEDYLPLVDAAQRVLGPTALHAVGHRRIEQDLGGGFFAAILQSWSEHFPPDPATSLMVVPHLWQAAIRHGGRLELVEAMHGEVRFRTTGAPRAVGYSTAWRALLEGFIEGLMQHLDLIEPTCCIEPEVDGVEATVSMRWKSNDR